jgi:hypothetical protein
MSVRKGQARLKKLAVQINGGAALNEVDRDFLATALQEIASGVDAESALGVKAQKGERKGQHALDSKVRRDVVNGWLAIAIAHEKEGGLGLTLKDAVSLIKAKMSDLPSEDTLRRYWNEVRKTQGEIFKIKTD